ncbi:MAG: chloride channel protein [Planctomycetaceae bacterium]|nr:chloride channel protein [Planctomycetaceae bacterium]
MNWFRWIPRFESRRLRGQIRLFGLSSLVGVVAGLGGIVFYVATRVVEHLALGNGAGYFPAPEPTGEPSFNWLPTSTGPLNPWLLLLIPAVGGFFSHWIVYWFAPEAEGDGTDAVIEAYHHRQGQIRPLVPLVKIIASALTLGTGGSGGREGPIAQIGAGFGSLLSNLLHLRTTDRRILMAAGMGAGIAAIFRAPLAGTIFAAEVLYMSPEFEPEVIIPAGIASVVAYCVFGMYSGWKQLFSIPALSFTDPWQLLPYLILAVCMAALAVFYIRVYFGCQRMFNRSPLGVHLRPVVGAMATGLVGVILYFAFGHQEKALAVLAFGYSAIQDVVQQDSQNMAMLLLAIAFGKIITNSLTIGSGGSGGVFGPAIVIGACGGGAVGLLLGRLWPSLAPHPAAFAIVGMAGFFAAAAKTPFSSILIVSEMTGGYSLLLPSLWVCVLAFILSGKRSIYRGQVESRSQSPAHRGSFVRELLAESRVREFLDAQRPFASLRPGDSLTTISERMTDADCSVLPVVNETGRLLGVVNLEEAFLATQSPSLDSLVVAADMMLSDVEPLTPDDTLDQAQELFVENDLLALPVVDDLDHRTVLGVVRRFDIANAYLRRLHGPTKPAAQ